MMLTRWGAENCTEEALLVIQHHYARIEEALARDDYEGCLEHLNHLRSACHRCAGRPHLERRLADSTFRMVRYIRLLGLAGGPNSAELGRWEIALLPKALVEACRERDDDAAEAATREAAMFVLGEVRNALSPYAELTLSA